jgi:hypothetical protein
MGDSKRVDDREMPEAPKQRQQERCSDLTEARPHSREGEAAPAELLREACEKTEE